MRLITPSQRIERASLCPNCGKPKMRRTIPRRQRLPLPRRRQIGDRFRSQLLNMAAGDVLLDAAGNVRLDASGNVILSNGLGDSCCCGSGSSSTCFCDPITENMLLTFGGATFCLTPSTLGQCGWTSFGPSVNIFLSATSAPSFALTVNQFFPSDCTWNGTVPISGTDCSAPFSGTATPDVSTSGCGNVDFSGILGGC